LAVAVVSAAFFALSLLLLQATANIKTGNKKSFFIFLVCLRIKTA